MREKNISSLAFSIFDSSGNILALSHQLLFSIFIVEFHIIHFFLNIRLVSVKMRLENKSESSTIEGQLAYIHNACLDHFCWWVEGREGGEKLSNLAPLPTKLDMTGYHVQ